MRLILTLLVLIPSSALAHAPIEGMNHFFNGVLHPVLIPAHIILLLATGLLIGRQGDEAIAGAVPVFMVAVIAGVLLSQWAVNLDVAPILLTTAILLGSVLVWGRQLPIMLLRISALTAALLVGIDSSQETFSGEERYIALFGTVVGVSFLVVYVAGMTEVIRKWLHGIPVRVLGSWLVASSLMVLVLGLQK
ncbi:MAG: Unknown protein [uncultured Thiotrichaceae bacterium]|uniref:HupE / UreJ protein n=1 Tax=uncultured Thiotrichaceae bacterium TaxID=298394 RepID=A0A6S6ST96_9GAMM|nr:MAG: Unknown protein [uncultured Thiotrichaceae bacterium]